MSHINHKSQPNENVVQHFECRNIINELKSQLHLLEKQQQEDLQNSSITEPKKQNDLLQNQMERIDYEKLAQQEKQKALEKKKKAAEKQKEEEEKKKEKEEKGETKQLVDGFNSKSRAHQMTYYSKAHIKEREKEKKKEKEKEELKLPRIPSLQVQSQAAIDTHSRQLNQSLNQEVQQRNSLRKSLMQDQVLNLYSIDKQESVARLRGRIQEYEKNKNRFNFQLNHPAVHKHTNPLDLSAEKQSVPLYDKQLNLNNFDEIHQLKLQTQVKKIEIVHKNKFIKSQISQHLEKCNTEFDSIRKILTNIKEQHQAKIQMHKISLDISSSILEKS